MKPSIIGPYPIALWPLLHEVSGATKPTYSQGFNFYDLPNFTPPPPGATIVVLGQQVARALGLPPGLIHPVVIGGVTWRQVPHPSGRNLWYNVAEHRTIVGVLLEELLCQTQ